VRRSHTLSLDSGGGDVRTFVASGIAVLGPEVDSDADDASTAFGGAIAGVDNDRAGNVDRYTLGLVHGRSSQRSLHHHSTDFLHDISCSFQKIGCESENSLSPLRSRE
jgi:hypothetical protein